MSRRSQESYDHILKYTGLFGGVQGLNLLISLVRNKLVAMLLGPGGMGLLSLFNTTINFLSQATNFGISFSAVRHVSEYYDQGDEQQIRHFVSVVRLWSLFTALLGMAVCFCVGPLLNHFTFSWGNHTLHFMMLTPAVGLMAITGGETAILKGTRQLRSLALIQVFSVVSALIISVPLFYYFGMTGIVPTIVLMALAAMLITIWFSYHLYPLQYGNQKRLMADGIPMVRLGLGFVVAGVMGSGAEMLIRSYLNVVSELNVVGLYNVGFILTMTYGGMVFSAMETDYFPRLSAVNKDLIQCNRMVNQQIEVSLLIIAPLLVVLLFAAPIIIPLLFTNEFLPVLPMLRITTMALYLRALKLPVGYLTLAKGDALSYMLMEGIYDVVMVVLVVFGYQWLGLQGTGVGLLMVAVFDFLMINSYTRYRYGFQLSASIARYALPQIAMGIAAFIATAFLDGWRYWSIGVVLATASFAFSISVLRRKTSLWAKLKERFTIKS